MAIYTREDAKNSARIAKKEKDYFIVVGISADFTKHQVKTLPSKSNDVRAVEQVYQDKLDWYTITVLSEQVQQKFPYANTIKDLEVIFYQIVNYKINELYQEVLKSLEKQKKEDEIRNNLEIYQANVGYNSVKFRFYVKVRETESSIWLQRIGKNLHGDDWQNAKVTPNPHEKIGEVFVRRKRSGGGIKIGDYEYASLWGGEVLQEYSD